MNLTYRQLVLLSIAVALFYDEVAKTSTPSTPEMKQELMELARIIQDAAMEAQVK